MKFHDCMAEPLSAPFLKFEDGDGREIPLISGNVWKIGRTEQNAVVLADDMVSRNHAMIQHEAGEFYLIDMGSRNGSFVNGRRLTAPVALRDGDRLSFGEARLRFRNSAQAAACVSPDTPARGQTIAFFKQANVSVLVVDIRGFTVLAQKVDAGVLSSLVSTWFTETDRIMHHYGCAAQKHIGDAVMAVWTHAAQGDERVEIQRILWAVAEIARMTDTLHVSFDLAEPVRIGAGVNTGLAVMGNTGAGGASDFTAIGDSVNVAFRLESATKELGADLALGAATFDSLRLCSAAATHFRASETNLKGYDAPVKTWHLSFAVLSEFLAQHGKESDTAIDSATTPATRVHHS
jgi:adenylate cyclase